MISESVWQMDMGTKAFKREKIMPSLKGEGKTNNLVTLILFSFLVCMSPKWKMGNE